MSDNKNFKLVVEIDSKRYTIFGGERKKMEQDIEPLRRQVGRFPVAELKIEITPHARPAGVCVKTSLLLPGTTLCSADADVVAYPAFQRCIHKLTNQLKAYKAELSNKPTYEKQIQGTQHDVGPTQEPNLGELEAAVATGDYPAFRRAMSVYEDSLSARAGRMIERFPGAARQLGEQLFLSQVVEDVLLTAFDRFERRPSTRLGQWLEDLIEPAIQALATNHGGERENLSYIASARGII